MPRAEWAVHGARLTSGNSALKGLTLRPALEDGLGTILSHLSKTTRTVRRPKPGICTPLHAGSGTRRDAIRRDALKTGVRSSRRLAISLRCPPSVVHPSVADATGIVRAASRALLLATMNVSGMALTRRSERRAILPPEYFIPEASIMIFCGTFSLSKNRKENVEKKTGGPERKRRVAAQFRHYSSPRTAIARAWDGFRSHR
ncbi:hypothetical protein KPH14_012581 [Odynerus spinipes]|uniref:Uncharacterized protein n=1 Tax=Odynerus spinipes TaxID=1348599 RepID=A0AAD9REU3_9HYME|nr:hypothetical protein KPH14_012581 [Odynerus spinipes]